MTPQEIASVSFIIGAVCLVVKRFVQGRSGVSDFEMGIAAGLSIAGTLSLLAPFVAELP